MGCVQQKQSKRQDALYADQADKDKGPNGINSQKTTPQENKKDVFQIKLNPIMQRRFTQDQRKQSDD